ncbi:MAG: hypothetical protein U5K69_01700 [Balneolaceae bacterium]|nr:hypothetical protein [Balneolaceae bacterium]
MLNDVFAGDDLEEKQAPQPFSLTDKEKLKLFRDDSEKEKPAADHEETDYEEEIDSSFEDWDSEDESDTAIEADSTFDEFIETETSSESELEDTGTPVEKEESYDEESGDESSFEALQQEEDGPIWQKFISSEEDAPWEEQQSEEEVREEEDEQEPLIDFNKPKNPNEKRLNKIKKMLEDDRERFVNEIFKGGEEAYEQALEEIAAMRKWRRASDFIDRYIFKRNLVDMYSEAAVDFTDRLQSYFTNETKSNQQQN